MHTRGVAALIAAGGLVFTGTAFGQSTPNPTQQLGTATAQGPTPLFRITVVGHTTPAINYRPRKGDTKVDFTGTALSPLAVGSAEVEGKTRSSIGSHLPHSSALNTSPTCSGR